MPESRLQRTRDAYPRTIPKKELEAMNAAIRVDPTRSPWWNFFSRSERQSLLKRSRRLNASR